MGDLDPTRRGSTGFVAFAKRRYDRAEPLRTYSQPDVQATEPVPAVKSSHSRAKSSYGADGVWRTPSKQSSRRTTDLQRLGAGEATTSIENTWSTPRLSGWMHELTPPVSPTRTVTGGGAAPYDAEQGEDDDDYDEANEIGVASYDFTQLDYELERNKVLGSGLWSTVYLAYSVPASPVVPDLNVLTPPNTPAKYPAKSVASLYAVKVPARSDAKAVLEAEARTLTRLQVRADAQQFIVGFEGIDQRNSALVFEAALGGSLENMNGRLKQLTELERHRELLSLFPGLASNLVDGLEFMHAAGIVHADIKPANILLDIAESRVGGEPPAVRARYIDFSAAFDPSTDDGAQNAGGTWDFMAPEQMRIQKELNTPTFASDVWSLGITLLTLIVGSSPYAAACGGNAFMLREAIKSGDPLQFARMDPVCHQRATASQDFIDCCRLALKKERENRVTAAAWGTWLETHELGIQTDWRW